MFNIYRTVLNTQINNISLSENFNQPPSIVQFPRSSEKGTNSTEEKDFGQNKQAKGKKGKNKKDDNNNNGGGGLLEPIIEDLKGWIGKKRSTSDVAYKQ